MLRTAAVFESLRDNPYFAEKIKNVAGDVTYLTERPDPDRLQGLLAEYDMLIIGARERITRDMLQVGPIRTRIIGTLSVGTDHLDMPALSQARIHVERCPTANVSSVAEHALALLLALSKQLKWGSKLTEAGKSRTDLPSPPFEVNGKSLGLIGYGNIGKALGGMASALGMRIIATSRTRTTGVAGDIHFGTLKEVLQKSHLLSVHVPLTDETRGLIDASALSDVRQGAILVNTSRAAIVDGSALRDALDTGRLAAYGGDFDDAPHDLITRSNVLVTPHMAGVTAESDARMDNELIDRIITHLGA